MKILRILLAAFAIPMLAPAVLYMFFLLIVVSSGDSLAFSLAGFYQIGLPYTYAILLLLGTPIFAILLFKKVRSLPAYSLAGSAIYPLLLVIAIGYYIVQGEQLNILAPENLVFDIIAILTGAVLGAVFWLIVVMDSYGKTPAKQIHKPEAAQSDSV